MNATIEVLSPVHLRVELEGESLGTAESMDDARARIERRMFDRYGLARAEPWGASGEREASKI